ncbi:uncharacterized protein C8orf58 homolog [Pteronotus mesoamericanus]|uniref:uncharacterized protein C8orf58 homolog n=1 Tax=Pteronotus mesoamericanus TaxID=1884717 RepID=UPI0023EBA8C5|nr:uncharacterized protein C8orf58 homolog [Pteronotus parnellii mesoamericanus]
MLGRRRVFAVEPRGGRDGAGQSSAQSCVVPGVTSAYRRIPDASPACAGGCWEPDGALKGALGQMPLLKLASRDSGVEMAVGDSALTSAPGLSQDSLDFEPVGSPEPLALPTEPPAHLGRLLASRKLEQVLERSSQLPTPPASLSGHHRSPKPRRKPEYEVPLFGGRGREASKAETDRGAGPEEAEVVRGVGPEAWACLPGQGLRYLEHLCLVLEQMARLQQLQLQLQTQRPPGVSEPGGSGGHGDPAEEEESALAPSPPSSPAPGSGLLGSWELLSRTRETGMGQPCLPPRPAGPGPEAGPPSPGLEGCVPVPRSGSSDSLSEGVKRASLPKVWVPSTHPPGLSEAPTEPAPTVPPSQSHKRDLSHWNKVKVLLNRIRWKSPQCPEPATPPAGPATRIGSRDLPERPSCRPLRKTFMPSLVVKKQRAKNLSVC